METSSRGGAPGAADVAQAFESVAVPVVVLDRDGRVQAINRVALDLMGATSRDGVDSDFCTGHIQPGDGTAPDGEAIRAACRDGTPLTVHEGQLRRLDGRPVAVRWTVRPRLVGGLLEGATLTVEDLSSLRRLSTRHGDALTALQAELDQARAERDHLRAARIGPRLRLGLHGDSPPLRRALERLEAAAVSSVPVMLCGAPGTGRRAMAHYLHARSQRQDAPLVWMTIDTEGSLELPGVASESAESVLGHALRIADGGTLGITRLERANTATQTALTALVEGQRSADVRLVTVCTERLMARVANGGFTEPLYYRLSAVTLPVPPLTERREDLALLVDELADDLAGTLDLDAASLGANQRHRLASRPWPGNLVQLEAEMTRILLDGAGTGAASVPNDAGVAADSRSGEGWMTEAQMRQLERDNTVAVMRACGGKVSGPGGGAEALGIKPNTLAYRLRTLGIRRTEYQPDRIRRPAGEPHPAR